MFRTFLVLLSVVGSLYGQIYEEMKVVLRDARFHVTDKDGIPIKGLTQEDFSFFIGKQPLTLTTFEEVDLIELRSKITGSTVNEVALPNRNIVIMIDSSNMDRRAFDQLVPSIEELIERESNPTTLIKLVQIEQRMTHLTPFTNQSDPLLRGLEKLEYQGWFRQHLMLLEKQVVLDYEEFRDSIDSGMPRSIRESNASNVFSSIDEKERAKRRHLDTFQANVLALARILAPMPGDRSILYFTGGLYLENRGRLKNTYYQMADLSRILNHFGVTIFSFVHNSPVAIGAPDWQSSSIGHVEPSSAMRELASYSPFRKEMDVIGLGSNNSLMENTSQLESGPREASGLTGGFFRSSSKWESLSFDVEDFFDATQHYYRFTYAIDQEQDRKKLKIELKNRKLDYVLRYGQRFKSPAPVEKWTAEEVLLNFEQTLLYGDVFRNDLDCEFGYRMFTSKEGKFIVPVFVGMTVDRPPVKGMATGFALFDEEHTLLDVVHSTVILGDKGKKPLLYQVLLSNRRPEFVRFFLQDLDDGALSFQESPLWISTSKSTSTSTDTRVLDPSSSTDTHILGLTVGESMDRDVIALHRYEAEGGAEKKRSDRVLHDPFFGKDPILVPPVDNKFDRDMVVPVFFQLCEARAPLAEYSVVFSLLRGSGKIDIPGQLTGVHHVTANTFRLEGMVQLKDAHAGEYDLAVTLETKNHEAVRAQTPIVVN